MGNTENRPALRTNELVHERSKGEVHEDWNISVGKLNGTSVTVFSAIHPPSSRKRTFMEKALQASKIYRHPGILRYMDGGIIEKEVVIITEAATPLLLYGLDKISALEITAGLASIVDALVFLHDKAGVSHNNICSASIYVTADGTWKLWGLEYCCSFGDLTRDHIEKINQYCSQRNLPPDDKSRISPAYQHSRDSYCLGRFIEDVIAPLMPLDIPFFDDFLAFIRSEALHSDWNKRPRLSEFLSQTLFEHEFLQLRHNINNILLLSPDERDEFIRELPETLRKYPDDVVASTYGHLLLSHPFMILPSSSKYLLPYVLVPKSNTESNSGLFTEPVFKEIIVPLILNLFKVHDATIRNSLLEHFEHFFPLITKESLTKIILPQLLLGIRDTDESLVGATLHCLAFLVPHLGADTVVGKHREHIFTTSKPKNDLCVRGHNVKRNQKELSCHPIDIEKTVAATSNAIESTCHELSSLPISPKIVLDIPERSSPDGGEVTDEDVFAAQDSKHADTTRRETDENWSDWEEMLDQPPPEIKGILQVKTPERESIPTDDFNDKNKISASEDSNRHLLKEVGNVSDKETSAIESLRDSRRKSSSSTQTSIGFPTKDVKVTAMQLKTSSLRKISHGLGEEYDIMSIKVEKKPDSELDLFADLVPNLNSNNFDLEKMLIEASKKIGGREKFPSLSDTLAELRSDAAAEEGDGWVEDEGEWDSNSHEMPCSVESGLPESDASTEPSDSQGNVILFSKIRNVIEKQGVLQCDSDQGEWNNSF